ncbi:hypothetical protein ACK8HJ_06895 [Vreelandella titanicae]|uniref:hypothetical protein n=1 Tax=Vreelandella titanicae TaxID=664683 RepID=UPI0003464CB3|tara:strand:- start:617 stop:790 length:174 start_codon:yes stop_codon:yes gene_type:complete
MSEENPDSLAAAQAAQKATHPKALPVTRLAAAQAAQKSSAATRAVNFACAAAQAVWL